MNEHIKITKKILKKMVNYINDCTIPSAVSFKGVEIMKHTGFTNIITLRSYYLARIPKPFWSIPTRNIIEHRNIET